MGLLALRQLIPRGILPRYQLRKPTLRTITGLYISDDEVPLLVRAKFGISWKIEVAEFQLTTLNNLCDNALRTMNRFAVVAIWSVT